MAQFDANINLIVNAQKAYKQIADLENRLDKLSNPKTKRQIQGVITQSKSDLKASEQRLANQIRLNAALERQANLVKGLTRAGVSGGRKGRVEELTEVGKKFKDNLRIQNAVNTALEKELQTLREINRTDRAQSATSSKVLTSVKQRLNALKAVGATASEINKIEKKRDALVSQNARKQTDLAKESFSQLDRQLATLERKYSTFLGKPGRQLASPIRGSKDTPGSPLYLEAQAKAADKAAAAAKRLADQQLRASKAAGGPRSPIGGSTSIPGSPKFLAAQAKKVADEEKKVNKLLADQQRLRERNAKAAKRTADQVARKRQQELQTARKQQASGLVGAGFPLLFGGGPGSIIGGAVGGALGGKVGLGFELSVGLGALGTVIDRLVGSARNLGNAFSSVDETLKQVQQIGFNVNRATEKRVQLLVEEGRATEAFLLILERTGITAQQVQNLRELDTAFDELQDSLAKLFVTVVSELTPAIVVISNLITDFVKGITGPEVQRAAANLDPQAFQAAQTQAASETSQFGIAGDRQAYERRLTELSRGIVAENAPGIDTSSLEKVNTLTKENLDLIQKRTAALQAGNDLSNESAYQAARQIVFAQTRLEVAEAEGNTEKIKIALARESLSLAELRDQKEKDIAQSLKTQARELERIEALQRKIRDAQLSAQLAEDIFAAQPLPDPTPFSRATPEQTRDQAVEEQALRYANEIAKIENQNISVLEREAKLREAAAKNDLKRLNINKQYNQTVKQREEQRISLTEDLQLQIKLGNAVTERAKELLQVEADAVKLRRDGILVTEAQVEAYKKLRMEAFDANNLTDFEQKIKDLTRAIGTELANAMQTALVDTITAAIQGADNLGEKLQALASGLLTNIGQLLFRAGLGMIGNANQGNLLGTLFGTRADGGPVNANRPYMVGERGPELFVPSSPGAVVTSEQSRAQLDMYSPGNAVDAPAGPMNVNMNYSGPTMAFDDKRYVPVEAIPGIIKDAAKQGEQRTLASMRNRVSTRNRVGI